MSVIVLIPAAGQGRRMGTAVSKQYLNLAGRPVLAHTLALFDSHPLIDAIYLLAPAADCADCRRQIVERYGFVKVRAVVAGGAERQQSVANGLKACAAAADDIILVHDGVRPFFPAELLAEIIATAREVGGCVVGVPVKDTIKTVVAGRIAGTPERSQLWQAQTPQAFPFAVLQRAYAAAEREGFRGTDDASLVERLGLPVAMLAGSDRNIKITTPEDLQLARAFCCDDEVER